MHRFVKSHLDVINESYENLGFKDEKDMLKQIKTDWKTAWWAIDELCSWAMKENYTKLFLVEESEDSRIYGVSGRFFKIHSEGIIEVNQVVKTIKVIDWE